MAATAVVPAPEASKPLEGSRTCDFPAFPPEQKSLPHVSALAVLTKYISKCVGVDMVYKTVAYTLRMWSLYSEAGPRKTWIDGLIWNILDVRMLNNKWKYFGTCRQAVLAITARRRPAKQTVPEWILTFMSFAFRTGEQFYADLGFWQKNFFKEEWSRTRLSWHYKFYKTMALTCCAILELLKIIPLVKKIRAAQARDGVNGSPVALPPSAAVSPVSPRPQRGAVLDVDPNMTALKRSSMFLFRNLCDMLIYYQWIERYNPYKTLEFTCGFLSGIIGVYIVWTDIAAEERQKIVDAEEAAALAQFEAAEAARGEDEDEPKEKRE